MKNIFIALLFAIYSLQASADNLSDSNRLFDWAEINYPQFFSPSTAETFQIDRYLARYYEKTDTYIGTLGEDVYVYGAVFNGLLYVGKINDFITLGKCSDNFPKPACDGINNVGTDVRAHFVSGDSCRSAFPEYEYDPSLSEGSESVCGLGFIECGACAVDP